MTHHVQPATAMAGRAAVSCLPILIPGMGAALAHFLRTDAQSAGQPRSAGPDQAADRADNGGAGPGQSEDRTARTIRPDHLTGTGAAATLLSTVGQRVSRRTLRTAGMHGSNADLGALARILGSQPIGGRELGDVVTSISLEAE